MFSGVTALTLFDLVVRSMRKNIKHYYLYFFALIFSVTLYFVFATLQHDDSVVARSGGSMGSAFAVAGILLLVIAGIFIIYANAIFLKRRSREIGLYQLIGLSKNKVVRLLMIENVLLSSGALFIGIGVGILVSRLFLLLLMKLIGFDGVISVSFSTTAVVQTIIVFMVIIGLTSIQMLFTVYRNTLLNLFNADKKGEIPKKPKSILSAIVAILGIALVVFGYWLSGRMLNEMLFFNMLAVLASTILGTYLLFRVTIGWVLYKIRASKQGHLGLKNSLSLATLMHRMKGNANSLTIITVLSAMTLTMLAVAYSLYYATEKETRYALPFDYMIEEWAEGHLTDEAISLEQFESELTTAGIDYTKTKLELLAVEGVYEKGIFPAVVGPRQFLANSYIVNASQLQEAGLAVEIPADGTLIYHDALIGKFVKDIETPFEIDVTSSNPTRTFKAVKYGEGDVINASAGSQLVVNENDFEKYKQEMVPESMEDVFEEWIVQTVYALNITDKNDLAQASHIYTQNCDEGRSCGIDYYSMYENSLEGSGLFIFIAGFLGLVFLISTGSILYFKQMTEAEQEKQSYKTLRQLGFSKKEIMRGIVRKQIFVFGLPLAIGLLHSIFAIKSASFLFVSDITVPTTIAMGVYALIYLLFAVLSVGYYKKTVSEAL